MRDVREVRVYEQEDQNTKTFQNFSIWLNDIPMIFVLANNPIPKLGYVPTQIE
jgi:hypothetical protein